MPCNSRSEKKRREEELAARLVLTKLYCSTGRKLQEEGKRKEKEEKETAV